MIGQPIEQVLRAGKEWLNGGECCGQVDGDGVCCAPACIFGTALKWFHAAADEIKRQQKMRHAVESERDAAQAEARELRDSLKAAIAELHDTREMIRAESVKIHKEFNKPDGSYWADNLISAVRQSLARIDAALAGKGEG